ncbi:MAG: hypothetical protein ABSB19_14085 [Methylomonas sp.]|jgi:hypothetical protein
MNKPKNLYRDVTTGVLFFIGVFVFMSGAFMLSTLLFAAAAISSNLDFRPAAEQEKLRPNA